MQTSHHPGHSIIWLHGLGADGHDFVPVADELRLPVPVRYIFPHAPMRPVTINGGFVMRAWYDITNWGSSEGLRSDVFQDKSGIRASQSIIENLIFDEMSNGIKPENIFLAGFSQGGAIALHTGLRLKTPIGGIMALSTYLPLANSAAAEMLAPTINTPIFMAHGQGDQVIPYEMGTASREKLLEFGYNVEWHDYPMQHSVCEAELRDIESWLTNIISR